MEWYSIINITHFLAFTTKASQLKRFHELVDEGSILQSHAGHASPD